MFSATTVGGGRGVCTVHHRPLLAHTLSVLASSPSLIARWLPQFKVGYPRGRRKNISSRDTLLGTRRSISPSILCIPTCLSGQNGVSCPQLNQGEGLSFEQSGPPLELGGGVSLSSVTCRMENWMNAQPY